MTKTIYLTDQVNRKPDIKDVSNDIMLNINDFYKNPKKADGYRTRTFTLQHHIAEDSGGFQFLMGKLKGGIPTKLTKDWIINLPDPHKTIDIYNRIGVQEEDLPMQLDLPPRYDLAKDRREALIEMSAYNYHVMRVQIPWVVPVVHGWTRRELLRSLELLEDPDKLATGSYLPLARRTKARMVGAGTFKATQAGGPGNLLSSNGKQGVAAGTNLGASKQYVIDNLKRPVVATGAFQIKPGFGRSAADLLAAGAFQQKQWVCDSLANTPNRKKAVAAGQFRPGPVYMVDHIQKKAIASPMTSKVDQGYSPESTHMVIVGRRSHGAIATPHQRAEQTVQKAPSRVVEERLATVLNLLRDRNLFILGGASPNDQHIIFMGGARYTDTSSWRLKGYLGEIWLPEIGARSIGYKATSKRMNEAEKALLRQCLKDSTHPVCGMSLKRFLDLGHMKVADYYKTVKKRRWPMKPGPLRMLHNAWAFKHAEEGIANEYANDPDAYYKYLLGRFKHSPILKKLKRIHGFLKRPYVQDTLDIFLKGQK